MLTPNTVFNFYNLLTPLPSNTALFGPEFGIYPPALAIQRANFIYGILNEWYSSTFPMATVLPSYQALAANPAALVEAVNQNLMFGRMSHRAARPDCRGDDGHHRHARPAGCASGRAARSTWRRSPASTRSTPTPRWPAPPRCSRRPGSRFRRSGGNTISVSWRAPLIGPAPTGYVLEGGVRPGEVLATIPINSTTPTFTFEAPPGAYYIRLRTVAGAGVSRPSGEVRLYVGAFSGPTAPRSLTGYGRRLVGGPQLAQHLRRRRADRHHGGCQPERRPRGQHSDAGHRHVELR